MNILFITEAMETGGTVTYARLLCKQLNESGDKVTLLTYSNSKNVNYTRFRTSFYKNIVIKKRRSLTLLLFFLFLYQQLKSNNQYDFVLTDLKLPSLTFGLIRRMKNIQTLWFYQFHGSELLEEEMSNSNKKRLVQKFKNSISFLIEKKILNSADLVIVFSDYAKSLLVSKFKTTNRIIKIFPGIEDHFLRGRRISKKFARDKIGLSEKKNIILILSRVEIRKGLHHFLDRVSKHERDTSNLYIIVSNFADRFDETFTFFQKHQQKKLGTKLLFFNAPNRNEMAFLYRASDLVFVPSIALETFGLVTLEAQTSGRLVLGFNIGANSELITKKWLIPLTSPEKLFIKIEKYKTLTQADKNKEIILQDKKLKFFTWENYCYSLKKEIKNI